MHESEIDMHGDRIEQLDGLQSVVVKLGTQLLSDPAGRLDHDFVGTIAAQVAKLRAGGMQVTLVSSGAIGCGLRELKLDKRPTDLALLQAVAAVGQRRLMDVWAGAFEPFGLPVAQILLTREDTDDRTRHLNLRNTILAVHELGAVPIINENDTVSTDELVRISFGDNDILAAMVSHALVADLLVLLTVVDGLLDETGSAIRTVKGVEGTSKLVRAEKSTLGKGGMDSKLAAAKTVTDAGAAMIVANGRMPDVLNRIVAGEEVGTLFCGSTRRRSGRTRWIGSVRPSGAIVIDAGARRALVDQHRSLLPAGIVSVEGTFQRGDVVAIKSQDGTELARGLTNYSSDDVERIRGKKTQEVRKTLADGAYDEVVHRNNLAMV
jgi:glutamate 5-kinase